MFVCSSVTAQTTTIKLQGVHGIAVTYYPDSANSYINGSAVIDKGSTRSIVIKWYQVSGPTRARIITPNQIATKVFSLRPGVYKFGFIVTDFRARKSDTAYTKITIIHP